MGSCNFKQKIFEPYNYCEFIILLSIWFKIVLLLFTSYKVIILLLFLKIMTLEKYYKLMFKEKKTKNPIYDLYTHSLIPN